MKIINESVHKTKDSGIHLFGFLYLKEYFITGKEFITFNQRDSLFVELFLPLTYHCVNDQKTKLFGMKLVNDRK